MLYIKKYYANLLMVTQFFRATVNAVQWEHCCRHALPMKCQKIFGECHSHFDDRWDPDNMFITEKIQSQDFLKTVMQNLKDMLACHNKGL